MRLGTFLTIALFLPALTACDDTNAPVVTDTCNADGGADGGGCSDGGSVAPAEFGPLVVDTEPSDQSVDLFGVPGHRIWVEVSEAQRTIMNAHMQGGGFGGDFYTPGGGNSTYADHVVVEDAVSGTVADYGKSEVRVVGESTFREWTPESIPNLKFDMDEFEDNQTLGGREHFRMNNGQVGSIFREAIAHRVFRELGYPGLRANFSFLGSNVWGSNVWIPMTIIEVYKEAFCDENKDLIGGTCKNMWEFPGDAGGGEPPPNACQIGECDNTRLEDLAAALETAPRGVGFREALEDIIDWKRYHQFQCLGWILWTGDDALRNQNNNLIIERDDGKLVWAPYSVDISAGQEWYTNTPLTGGSIIAQGCQSDENCWADTIAECEALITKFDKLNPEKMVDKTAKTLTDLGMMRPGDEGRAKSLRKWYVDRQKALTAELERYRYLPGPDGCPNDLDLCNDGTCGTKEQCEERLCQDGQVFCETYGYCVGPKDFCPSCDTETSPFFCGAFAECTADFDACSDRCSDDFGPGYLYCEFNQSCQLPQDCNFFPGPK